MEPMLKGSQELPKNKLIKSSNVNSVEMVFCRCVICFCFLLFFLFCFVCLFFLCHQRVGVRFSVIPPQFERTLRQFQLWPQYIYLSIISLVLCTKGRTLWCYVTGSFFSYKSHYQKTAQQNRENSRFHYRKNENFPIKIQRGWDDTRTMIKDMRSFQFIYNSYRLFV